MDHLAHASENSDIAYTIKQQLWSVNADAQKLVQIIGSSHVDQRIMLYFQHTCSVQSRSK